MSIQRYITYVLFNLCAYGGSVAIYMSVTAYIGSFIGPSTFESTGQEMPLSIRIFLYLWGGFLIELLLCTLVWTIKINIVDPSITEWKLHKQRQRDARMKEN